MAGRGRAVVVGRRSSVEGPSRGAVGNNDEAEEEWVEDQSDDLEDDLPRRRPTPGKQRARKGKNFVANEEIQLARSVLAISQDPICGNQQRAGAFWERVFLHYDERRVGGKRGARSLESKWSNVKHDVAKYIGNYWQVKGLKPIGTSEEDIRAWRQKFTSKNMRRERSLDIFTSGSS
jgi:hypothetical protein